MKRSRYERQFEQKKAVEKVRLLSKRVVITNVNTSWSILFLLKMMDKACECYELRAPLKAPCNT